MAFDTNFVSAFPGFQTTFIYSEYNIINTVIPNLLDMGDTTSVELWWSFINDNNERKEAVGVAERNISFDAGAVYEYEQTVDTSETYSYSVNVDINNETMISLGAYAAGVGAELGGKFLFNKVTEDSEGNSLQRSVTTGFVLADDDIGDLFSVDIFNDPVYQTPLFKLRGGQSSCPWEPNSAPRQTTSLSSDGFFRTNVPYNDAAVFNLRLGNESQTGEDNFYTLGLAPESNTGGAIVKVNGSTLSEVGYVIPAGGLQEVVLTVERNPNTEQTIYENLEVALYSQCEKDRADGLAIVTDSTFYPSILLNVEFLEPCSPVDVSSPSPGWVHLQSSGPNLSIEIFDYDKDDEDLESISVQFRRTQGDGDWITI